MRSLKASAVTVLVGATAVAAAACWPPLDELSTGAASSSGGASTASASSGKASSSMATTGSSGGGGAASSTAATNASAATASSSSTAASSSSAASGSSGSGGAATYEGEVMLDAPLAYYRLDETSGTVAKDSSGNGRDATYQGAVTFGAKGAIASDPDAAASFDGASAAIDMGAALDPSDKNTFAQGFTIELWMQPASVPGMNFPRMFSKEDLSNIATRSGALIYLDQPSGVSYQRWEGGTLVNQANTSQAPSTTAYTHVVVTFDATPASKSTKLYLNATLLFSGGPLDSSTPSPVANDAFFAQASNGGALFTGMLDEIAIYDHPLSGTRVKAHYDAAQ